jgi:biopolymer transport protein ExbD
MAFGRLERQPPPRPMADINMTPMIDVMLVLLVIFMVTAPLVAASLKLELPAVDGSAPAGDRPSITLSLDAAGTLRLERNDLSWAELDSALATAARRDPHTELHLRIDRTVAYGQVAELIGRAQRAGLTRIGFVTEPADGTQAGFPRGAAPAR